MLYQFDYMPIASKIRIIYEKTTYELWIINSLYFDMSLIINI